MDWTNLRPWNGSQNTAFEELCCQLAHADVPAPSARFVRKGTPDAGVECYWVLANDDEHAWQAKFFFELGNLQWRDIDESVETALNKHPHLVRYTLCLPLDLSDARMTRKSGTRVKSQKDIWNEHLVKWRASAQKLGIALEFEYWGQFEIGERLSQERHRGRMLFWFNKELFSESWFSQRLAVAIANADQRYLPELNVELPIRDVFRGLGRTSEFVNNLKRTGGDIRRAHEWCVRDKQLNAIGGDEIQALKTGVCSFLGLLDRVAPADITPCPFDLLTQATEGVCSAIFRLQDLITDLIRENEGHSATDSSTAKAEVPETEKLRSARYFLDNLLSALRKFQHFAESDQAALANKPVMLLVGEPGAGKTHLLCEIADERTAAGLPTVLVLGEQFVNSEPWKQVLSSLQLNCSTEDFLGALNSVGEAVGGRCLLLLDALNEGEGQALWPKYLAGFLVELARFPWIGIALSVRRSYEDTIRDGLVQAGADGQGRS